MAEILKLVDARIPKLQRSVTFTHTEANQGDILLIQDSLKKPVSYMRVLTSGGYLEIRPNIKQTVYPRRPNDGLYNTQHLPMVASGEVIYASGNAVLHIDDASEFVYERSIKDVQLITVAGQFEMYFR